MVPEFFYRSFQDFLWNRMTDPAELGGRLGGRPPMIFGLLKKAWGRPPPPIIWPLVCYRPSKDFDRAPALNFIVISFVSYLRPKCWTLRRVSIGRATLEKEVKI